MPGTKNLPKYGEENPKPYYKECWISDLAYKNDNGDCVGHGGLIIKAHAIFCNDEYPGLDAATVSRFTS